MRPVQFTKRIALLWLIGTAALLPPSIFAAEAARDATEVRITEDIPSVTIQHRGHTVTIKRIEDTENRLVDDFTKTSRPCPPFCIHPMEAAPGVRTIGEVELLDFLREEVSVEKGTLIDARMPEWYHAEAIPGSVNIPFVVLSSPSAQRDEILKLLGGRPLGADKYDFTAATRLALYCNGPWCDQSTRAIKGLIAAGYPPEKLLYYRGGMQLWKLMGLTTVLPKSQVVRHH
ncbi:MAG: rhodanese-like domain-containing protein [Thiotrichales bacterium]